MILEAESNQSTCPRNRFEAAALPLRDFLYSKAVKLTGNPNDADDLLQDTFVLGLRKFHMFREGTNLKAWLARLQFNLFVSHYRRRRNRPDGVRLDDVGDVMTDRSVSHGFGRLESLSGAELAQDQALLESLPGELKHGLEELDPRYRDVLLMSAVGEKSYQDIANALCVPVGTVMSRLSRAKAALREYLADMPALAG